MKLQLPRAIGFDPACHIALVRKACHFDGLLNGRFEFLFRVKKEPRSFAAVSAIARWLLDVPVALRIGKPDRERKLMTLGRASPAVASLWARATVASRSEPETRGVRAGRALIFSESNVRLGAVEPGAPAGARLFIERTARPFEHFVIYPPRNVEVGDHTFRADSRYFRTYFLRMLQDIEAMSQMCDINGLSLDGDRAQSIFNEYTRHISRSRLPAGVTVDLLDYCYAAFDRLYPGKIEDLRPRIIQSNIRPNVKRKMLELLSYARAASDERRWTTFVDGDQIMGDKFENITATGQGIAIGRGASAHAENVGNSGAGAELGAALRELAKIVRQSDHEEAGIEAECLESAATKAEQGDDKGVVSYLKKSGKWALDLATTVGSATLEAYIKAHIGLAG